MSLKQSIGLFHLTRGLGSPDTVEVVFDSQSLSDPLDDFGLEGPLSLWKVWGSPNLGIISLIRTLITSQASSEEQRNASTHLINASTKTRSNLEVGPPGR
jgi:hypothetical protein